MPQITFKATRRKSGSGWRELDKGGDLQYDIDRRSKDGIWLRTPKGSRIFIDCDHKTGVFRIAFHKDEFEVIDENYQARP